MAASEKEFRLTSDVSQQCLDPPYRSPSPLFPIPTAPLFLPLNKAPPVCVLMLYTMYTLLWQRSVVRSASNGVNGVTIPVCLCSLTSEVNLGSYHS